MWAVVGLADYERKMSVTLAYRNFREWPAKLG